MAATPPEQQPEEPAEEPAEGPAEEPAEQPPPAPLLELRDGLPPVVDTAAGLAATVAALAAASGPVAVDAERASGYRYSSRAYLLQLRREGTGTHLVDPIAFADLSSLQDAIADAEWIVHAASQDLPCLAEIGLRPVALFDTELAGRLLGYPRVGLATLVEALLGRRMRKEHSAVDWSTRPLPQPWLEYAALDVEVLVELRDLLADELVATDKDGWAREEFSHLVTAYATGTTAPRLDPWRRTSGLHRAKGRRAVAAVRELWLARDEIASRRDVTPGRVIPDSSIVEAANALPRERRGLLGLRGFTGRGANRYAGTWLEALARARELPEADLPPLGARYDGPPPPRSWADRDPEAAARLAAARTSLKLLAEEVGVPVENVLTPDFVRRLLWEPPEPGPDGDLGEAVVDRLVGYGARAWQVALTRDLLVGAIRAPRQPKAPDVSPPPAR